MIKIDFFEVFRCFRLRYYRSRIKNNKDLTIICNNCLGGVLYHNFGMRFCSPFVNLMIPTSHYIELLVKINKIADYEIIDITPAGNKYPIGLLNYKWELHFMHYKTYDEAYRKWKERCQRIDFESLYVVLVETHSARYSDLYAFDKLCIKNKIMLTSKPYPEFKCAFPIKGFDGVNLNGEILWPSNRWGACKYDQVDWLGFLNLR